MIILSLFAILVVFPLYNCNSGHQRSSEPGFKEFTKSYSPRPLPAEYSHSDVDFGRRTPVDSLVITHFIDPAFLSEDAGNRTYNYYMGDKLDITQKFTALIHLFSFNAGFQYHLYTYDSIGKRIDSLEIAGSNGDDYVQDARIEKDLSISVKRTFYKYDEAKDSPYLDSTATYKYQINENGEIVGK